MVVLEKLLETLKEDIFKLSLTSLLTA